MPRYFFILAYPDQEIGDPRGVIVPSDEAAIEAGRKIIDELLVERGPEDPSPTIIIRLRTKRARSSINSPAIENQAMPERRFPQRSPN